LQNHADEIRIPGVSVSEPAIGSSGAEGLQIPPLRSRARLRRVITFGVLLAGAAAAGIFLMRPSPAAELYHTVPVARRSIVRLVDATGHIGVTGRVEVAASFSGRLVQILVEPGARVKKGQLLAKLDDRAQRLAVSQAQASQRAAAGRLAEARVAYNAAWEEQQHSERLAQRGLASQQDAVNAKTAADRAAAALAAAQAEESAASGSVASAALGHNSTDIVAPADGIVLKAPETLGMMVDPESALFVIGASLEMLRIDALVNETDIAQVRVGQATQFEVQGLPGRTFEARVERIALEPEIESGLVRYPVALSTSNADGLLLPGMTALVHLEVARVEHALAVHEAALRFSLDDAPPTPPRTRLWRRTGPAQAEPVAIRAGLSDGAFTEVTAAEGESLREGDPIVIGLFRPDEPDAERPSITLGNKP
jgi:HlyD family secretion protein